MKKTRIPLMAALAGLLAFTGPAQADDIDILLLQPVKPNVVIIFDTSGSMQSAPSSGGSTSKFDIAKGVVTDLISTTTNVNFGVLGFANNGAAMIAEVGTPAATMVSAVNNRSSSSVGTPLGDALYDAGKYFQGNFGSYASPIQYSCQQNFIILMTDGLPNRDNRDPMSDVAATIAATDHSSTFGGTQSVVVHTIGFDIDAGRDLLEATAAAGGGNAYTVNDTAGLQAAFADAVGSVQAAAQSFAQPLVPSTSATGGNLAYLASFLPVDGEPFWPGELKAYTRTSDGKVPTDANNKPLASALAWDAAALLTAQSASSRTIYTAVGSTREVFATSNGNVTTSLLGAATAAERLQIIDFIRGLDTYDHDGDSNTTEERDAKLGSIFHSDPVLVFPPPRQSTDPDYNAFKTANASRATIVLAGANDGMLHAFRASDGVELWGFIPPDMLSRLKDLAATTGDPEYYVDSSPVVTDIKIGTSWKTIAVFGERRGGSSYHALDITDTTSPGYLWSFTDSELGETWSEPTIGKVKMSDGSTKWVAFVGGGYNTASNNASGRAVYAIDLATGSKLWEYKYAATGDAQYFNFSVPATPTAADLDGNGFIDRVYIGDVGGQLWKFDTSAPATLVSGLVSNWTGKRLFQANPSGTNPPAAGDYIAPQAMYGSPALAYDGSGDLWVYVGTGDRNHPTESSANRFYGIKDNTTMANASSLTESSLVDATAGSTVTQGWYYPLAADEKALGSADVFDEVVYFTTYVPTTPNPCQFATGQTRLYAVRMSDGLAAINFSTGAKLTNPTASDPASTNGGGGLGSDPDIRTEGNGDGVIVGSSDGEVIEIALPDTEVKRLRYWREVM